MADQKQYLEWHGQQWRVRMKVPAKLRDVLGKGKLIYPLHTSDLKEAEARKWSHVARFKAIITEAEKALNNSDPLLAEALQMRLNNDRESVGYAAIIRAEEIKKQHGYTAAKPFYDIATGQATPLALHSDSFLAHQDYRQKTEGDFKRVLGWLIEYYKSQHIPLTLEAVNRKLASQFINESLLVGRSHKKVQSYLGFLREYWKWLVDKGHLDSENPWTGQSLPKERRPDRDAEADGGKRPFTDDEMIALLNGPAVPRQHDLMRIAALSGMRLEEICSLRVSDCVDGSFHIKGGKTVNAARSVPIHSQLSSIITRRTKSKQPKDWLIEDLPDVPASREGRSDPASKQFSRYRVSVGVDERPNEKAKSNVDFHSFRRWFIRKARNAKLVGGTGYDEVTLVWVVGHVDSGRDKTLDLSQIGYAGQDPEAAKRALVEAVTLPAQNHNKK